MRPVDPLEERARELDAADPLAGFRDRFVPMAPEVVAYFDGNSLGRPVRGAMGGFVDDAWGGRLIRGWTDSEGWLEWPEQVGDRIGSLVGAGPGQVVVADSTTVLLYKLARAAVAARPGRREIVADRQEFPTDRYVLEGIAAETGCSTRWVSSDPVEGLAVSDLEGVVGSDTALVVTSLVAYRSAALADLAGVAGVVRDAGALLLADLSHAVGAVEVRLDEWGVDLAVGCTYKYLNGGPGSPAFAFVRRELQAEVQQPIWGWMGRRDPFAMAQGYEPVDGIRSMLSGTPPVLAMVPLMASLDLLEEAGMGAVRAKGVALTSFALECADAWLPGVTVASPRDAARRGSHVTLQHAGFREVVDELWLRGVIPDYREPDGLRIGLSPLSTSFAEVHAGMRALRELVSQ